MIDANSMHRLTKLLIDSGEAASVQEAIDSFSRYGVRIRLGADIAHDVAGQIIALTAINCAARSFNGNVVIEGDDFELIAPGFESTRLAKFIDSVGVKSSHNASQSWPRVVINHDSAERGDILAWSAGWHFGLGAPHTGGPPFPPSCVAVAGLAINEAFSILRLDNPYAGRRKIKLSLWNPASLDSTAPSHQDLARPGGLWLIGAGHLGQAYAWTLGFMPAGPEPIFLQDIDVVTNSTISTSMVSQRSDCGRKKTRVVAQWLEARGYKTALIERRFDGSQQLRPEEPGVALFGVDNAAARRVAEGAGFQHIIDAGLGSGPRDFRGIRIRTFPGPSAAAALWSSEQQNREPLATAYQQMVKDGADACGVTQLATRAVGAPFVGCVAAGYVLGELIRQNVGGPTFGFLDMHLRDPEQLGVG
jgi:hypothetical protein